MVPQGLASGERKAKSWIRSGPQREVKGDTAPGAGSVSGAVLPLVLPTLPTESARSGCKWSSTWMHCMFWYGYVVRREHAGLVRTSFNLLPACGNRMELAAVDVW